MELDFALGATIPSLNLDLRPGCHQAGASPDFFRPELLADHGFAHYSPLFARAHHHTAHKKIWATAKFSHFTSARSKTKLRYYSYSSRFTRHVQEHQKMVIILFMSSANKQNMFFLSPFAFGTFKTLLAIFCQKKVVFKAQNTHFGKFENPAPPPYL